MKVISKEIDLKSLIIGFLLAAVLFLTLGAGGSSGTQDVRIVGVSTYDALRIKIDDVNSSVEVPVKITEVKYAVEIPVKIEDQPINVRIKQ
jgi:hypothetical protein